MSRAKSDKKKMPEEFAATMDKFEPVECDIKAEIAEGMKDPEYRKAYEESEEEFALLRAMLNAQRHSNLSQAEIAERMGIKQPGVSRMFSGKHRTTFKSALSFIHANGMRIKKIDLEPIDPDDEELQEN